MKPFPPDPPAKVKTRPSTRRGVWRLGRARPRHIPPSLALKRFVESLATLAILVTLTFLAAHAVPGGPAYAILGMKATPQGVGAIDLRLGLDVPIWRQYLIWWWHLLHGNLGTSYLLNRPVAALLAEYQARTLVLYGAGLSLGTMLALAGGLLHGCLAARWPGRAFAALELTLYALPSFFVGTVLMALFATHLHWLPAGGAQDLHLSNPTAWDTGRHLVLPVCTIALAVYAGLAPYFSQSVAEELGRPYVRTARAKGLDTVAVLLRHALPNALRPLVTLLGLSLPALIAGSVVVESVFSFPGLAWLLWRSSLARDYPVLIGIVLLVGVATIAGNLAAELLNTWLDPRALYV